MGNAVGEFIVSQRRAYRMAIAVAVALGFVAACHALSTAKDSGLRQAFMDPPPSARPRVLWMWMGCNVTASGITRDLEEMKKAGIGGGNIFVLCDATVPGGVTISNSPTAGLKVWSAEWWKLLAHAAREADRLGLELGMHNCPGYSASGGPWITAEHAMKKLVWVEQRVKGPGRVVVNLPPPKEECFCDVAMLAYPAEGVIPLDHVIELKSLPDEKGQLTWDVPSGEWTMARFGYAVLRNYNHPAAPEATGLECDKLSAEAAEFHLCEVLGKLKMYLGPTVGHSFKFLHWDSYEAAKPTWTPKMREEFLARRSYDLIPWLPVFAGRSVGSAEASRRFEVEWMQTRQQMFRDNHFAVARRLLQVEGLEVCSEPYWGGLPDPVELTPLLDRPMGEFWTGGSGDARPVIGRYRPIGVNDVVGAAQAAGISVVAAEAFTAWPQASAWTESPAWLKAIGDAAFCAGINSLYFHRFPHQPWDERYSPGLTMGWWGTQITWKQTWWKPGAAWLKYLWRCQALLQRGESVADICFIRGYVPGRSMPVPEGYRWAVCPEQWLERIHVQNGRVVLPSGQSYEVLGFNMFPISGPSKDTLMSRATLMQIKRLADAGARLVSARPVGSSLAIAGLAENEEVRRLAGELWAPTGKVSTTITPQIIGLPPQCIISAEKKGPVVTWTQRRDKDAEIFFLANSVTNTGTVRAICRGAGTPELWDPLDGSVLELPEYRQTEDGRIEIPLRFESEQAYFVVFRKKDETANSAKKKNNFSEFKPVMEISGPWDVTFDPKWGGPDKSVVFDQLEDWTKRPEHGIRYYSGTAVYKKTFDFPAVDGRQLTVDSAAPNRPPSTVHRPSMWLSLGKVNVIASVRLNGKDCGVAWCPPWRVEISTAIKPGKNELEIEVANLWANRLIGDEQEPADCEYRPGDKAGNGAVLKVFPDWFVRGVQRPSQGRYGFTTYNFFKKDSPLQPSGLLGPVNVMREE